MTNSQLAGFAAALAFGAADAAQAQSESDYETVEEVVVTSLRTESAASETPASLTAITGDTLETLGLSDISALDGLAPGFRTIRNGPSNTRLVLRGIQGVGEPIVGLYYDETPVTGLTGAGNDAAGSSALVSLVDVERVEILRGPQGALYGSGAMTGAVRVIWRKPQAEPEAQLLVSTSSADGGGYGGRLEGVINVPMIEDKLAARAAIWAEDGPGFIRNQFLGRDVDGAQLRGGRVALRATPTPRITLDASALWQASRGDIPLWNLGLGEFRANNQARLLNDDEQLILNLTGTWRGDFAEVTAYASHARRTLDQVNADVSYQFGTLIDNPAVCARLRGGGSACTPVQQDAFNAYVRSFIPGVVYPRQDASTDTAEIRLSSVGDRSLSWTVGGFYSKRDGTLDNSGLNADPASGALLDPLVYTFRRNVDEQLTQTAVFGEATWKLTSDLEATLGARAFRYERSVGGGTTQGLDLINAKPTAYQRATGADESSVLKLGAAWRPAPNRLVYASASQGYRPGGVNQVLNLPQALVPYKPDKLWTYEAGLKAELFERRLAVNADVFRIDWDDMQVAGSRPDGLFRFIANAGQARVDGVEAAFEARPAGRLSVNGRLAIMDARLVEDQVSSVVVAAGRAGDRIPYAPRTTAGLTVGDSWTVGGGYDLGLLVDARYVSESWSEFRPNNPYYRRLPDSTLVDLRLRLTSPATRWEAALGVDNLFDEVAVSGVTANAITTGQTLVVTAPPRTVSLQLRLTI